MADQSYISQVHPCPACKTLVANVALVCHQCSAPQPHPVSLNIASQPQDEETEAGPPRAAREEPKSTDVVRSLRERLGLRPRHRPESC